VRRALGRLLHDAQGCPGEVVILGLA
jgi:hypothetical protein